MAKVFTKANAAVMEMLADVMQEYHPEIASLDLEIGVTMVLPNLDKEGNPTGAAITRNGAAAAARIKIVSVQDRVHDGLDVKIEIDQARWNTMEAPERRALLDHELTHLRIVTDKNGVMKTHDDLRPVLAMRPDDFTLTGFHEVIERHGESAIELQSLKTVTHRWQQQYFSWSDGEKKSKRKTVAA